MRAVTIQQHGGIEELTLRHDHAEPVPGPGEVVVKVAACALNAHDLFTLKGMPGIRIPMPIVMGIDIAGEVAALGEGVAGWAPGDRVVIHPILQHRPGLIGETVDGGLAEYVRCAASQLIRLDPAISFEDAAALPCAYGTAYRMMMTRGRVKAGEKVLILGASGGVGTCSLQLARMAGCEVIACASSPDKLARLRQLGADHVIDYRASDFREQVIAMFGKPRVRGEGGGVDVVVNFTGGDTWAKALKVLRRDGRMLTCGATAGFDPPTDIRYIWTFELNIIGSNGWSAGDVEALLALVKAGRITPVIDRVLPLEETREAFRLLRDREVFGKVIVRP